jgi:hypothetical protein
MLFLNRFLTETSAQKNGKSTFDHSYSGVPTEPTEPTSSPSAWDQAAADAALAEALALLDRALAMGGAADTDVKRRVVGHYRAALQAVHGRQDPAILEATTAVGKLLARWQTPPGALDEWIKPPT